MVLGQTCGLVRLVLDFVYPAPSCDETDTRPSIVANVNFTYFSAILIVLSAFLAVIISLCTPKPTPEMVSLQSVRFQCLCMENECSTFVHTDFLKIQNIFTLNIYGVATFCLGSKIASAKMEEESVEQV